MKITRCCAALLLALLAQAHAQGSYPTKPIRIMTASPGTSMDISSRVIAARMSERLGQSVIVEARPGGGSAVAATVVAAAPPDGYTLLLFSDQITINPSVIKNLSYDPVKDFTAIGRVGYLLIGIAVNSAFPAKNINDLIAMAKAKPGDIRYGTPGVATPHHLAMEYFSKSKGIVLTHIPFAQSPAVINETVAGRIEIGSGGMGALTPQAQAGKLRILAVIAKERSPLWPDIPALGEYGVDLNGPWFGFMGPGGLPRDMVERLNRDLNATLAMPDVKEQLNKLGTGVVPSTPAEFAQQIKDDTERWHKVIATAGIKAS